METAAQRYPPTKSYGRTTPKKESEQEFCNFIAHQSKPALEEEVLDADIEALIEKRQEARANRDFATADAIRDQLAAQGIKLLDTKDGVRWTCD